MSANLAGKLCCWYSGCSERERAIDTGFGEGLKLKQENFEKSLAAANEFIQFSDLTPPVVIPTQEHIEKIANFKVSYIDTPSFSKLGFFLSLAHENNDGLNHIYCYSRNPLALEKAKALLLLRAYFRKERGLDKLRLQNEHINISTLDDLLALRPPCQKVIKNAYWAEVAFASAYLFGDVADFRAVFYKFHGNVVDVANIYGCPEIVIEQIVAENIGKRSFV